MAEGRDITAEVKRIIKEQLDLDEKDIKPESTFIDADISSRYCSTVGGPSSELTRRMRSA